MKYCVLLVLMMTVVSCATPKYMHLYESPKSLDFTTGKWLVTNVEAQLPFAYREGLTRDLLKELRKLGGDSIYFLNDISLKYLSHDKLSFELSPEVMETLKKTTDYKYVVTSSAQKLRNEVGDLIYPGGPLSYQKSESEVCIAVYDVSLGARIYFSANHCFCDSGCGRRASRVCSFCRYIII